MKKAHKKVLGTLGLVAVAAMTAFAAFIPVPMTQAVSSVTDTIVVRVVSASSNVYLTEPPNGAVFTGPEQEVVYNYENVDQVTVYLVYVDEGGTEHPVSMGTFSPSDDVGTGSTTINFETDGYGYGHYIIRLAGEGRDGLPCGDSREVYYLPVTAAVEEDEETGDADVSLDYDVDSEDIDTLELNVYDKDGNLITELSPIKVAKPGKNVVIPFSETNLPAGEYTITVTALDENGNPLQEPYELIFNYRPVEVPDSGGSDADVPNTGGIMTTLNVSKADYLVTGLLVFAIVGIVGASVVIKGRKTDDKKRR